MPFSYYTQMIQLWGIVPAGIYFFSVNNESCSGVFIVKFEQILEASIVFPLLTLSK